MRVLVVDIDRAAAEAECEILSSFGAEPRVFEDGEQAASLVGDERFDAIFLDVAGSGIDGFELCRRIRASAWNKTTPIIVVSAFCDSLVRTQAFEAGATFFLDKPVDKVKLGRAFNSALGLMLEERLRVRRVPVRMEVVCQAGSRIFSAIAANISQEALLVESADVPPEGSSVRLSFRLPGAREDTGAVGVVAKIIDQSKADIHFTWLTADNRHSIRSLVLEHTNLDEIYASLGLPGRPDVSLPK